MFLNFSQRFDQVLIFSDSHHWRIGINWRHHYVINSKERVTNRWTIFGTIVQLYRAESLQLRHLSTIGKKLVKQQYLLHMSHNMANLGPLAAEICWRVCGTPTNFNWFRAWAALLHGTLVVGVSQTLWRWTEGAIYIRQGSHHVWRCHWPTF